jgi:hypothetical protein
MARAVDGNHQGLKRVTAKLRYCGIKDELPLSKEKEVSLSISPLEQEQRRNVQLQAWCNAYQIVKAW